MRLQNWFVSSKDNTGRARIISMMGLTRGVGTTHLAIMLGMYFVNGKNSRVALVEYGQHGDYEKIKREEKIKKARLSIDEAQRHVFSFRGVDFYESVQNKGLIGILSGYYDYIILDMRTEESLLGLSSLLGDWKGADVSIAVITVSPWKARSCRAALNKIMGMSAGKEIKVVSLTKNIRRHKREKNSEHIRIGQIPWEPDPFYIRAENMPWLESLVK